MKLFLENTLLLSYPKAGRTWARVLLAKLLEFMGGDPKRQELIRYRHAPPCYNGYDKTGMIDNAFVSDIFHLKKIIILARDPRDIIVSNYFQVTLREKEKWNFDGSMSEFIRDEKFGINDIINFYNVWFQNLQGHQDFMFLKYEDMKKNIMHELHCICSFLGINLGRSILKQIVEYSSFENMRKMDLDEKDNLLSGCEALGGKLYNQYQGQEKEEAMKIRRGIVGGYVDYLNEKDIAYINERLKNLHFFYGY